MALVRTRSFAWHTQAGIVGKIPLDIATITLLLHRVEFQFRPVLV